MMVEGQIRTALRDLIAPLDGLKDHVTFDETEVPSDLDGYWCAITLGDESIDQLTAGMPSTGAKQVHTLGINIDVFFMSSSEALAGAEDLLERLIPVVFGDRTLGGLVKSFVAIGKARAKSTEGQPVARIRLQCQTVFQTFDRDPSRSV